jgi:FixJ family two-component response regulator
MGQASEVGLHVDDDQAVGEAIADLLQENGYSVRLFTDGAAFLDAYRPGSHGCLLVDALMPGMSGIALIERIKSDGHDLPAIVITGSGALPMAVKAMKAAAVDLSRSRSVIKICSPASDVRSIRRATQQRCPNCAKPRRQALQV